MAVLLALGRARWHVMCGDSLSCSESGEVACVVVLLW